MNDRVALEEELRQAQQRTPQTDAEMATVIEKRAIAAWKFYVALQTQGFRDEEALHLVAALGI